jgi:hypothetical protein
MADKHPKRPNNNAKALEGWESEGGASGSDDPSTKKKRPRDLNVWAKRMVDIVSGEVEDREPTPEEQGKDPAAVALGRKGGLKGGKARAESLSPKQRSAAAKKAAAARWRED